jgi:ADP-ribose pyrophosphatase YjhB (NUDIX family)
MTDDEIEQLALLLQKLAAEGLGTPRTPKQVFVAFRGVVTQPTVELLVTRNGRDVLLTPRHDKHWAGHHLPGGFVGVGENLQAACDRIARVELGTGASLARLVGHYTWTDHPYASPLSLLCLVRLDGSPRAGEFFEPLPNDLLRQHRALLESCWPEAAPAR